MKMLLAGLEAETMPKGPRLCSSWAFRSAGSQNRVATTFSESSSCRRAASGRG